MTHGTVPGEELLAKSVSIGQYYGFLPFTGLTNPIRGQIQKVTLPDARAGIDVENDPIAEIVTSFLKRCQRLGCTPSAKQPLFVWHANITPGRPIQKRTIIQFHALGTDRAIADTVVIRALLSLVRDTFHTEPLVRVNSMGDRETRARYARELGLFFKKRAGILPEECLVTARQNVFEAAKLAIAHSWADDLPTPIEYLSDASRKHFEDLLEYLEMTETPYELARTLLNHGSVWNDICFEIVANGRQVAWGSHYDMLVRSYFPLAPFPSIGAVFRVTSGGAVVKKPARARLRISFVHIGDEAKRISIRLAEEFRHARIPLMQHIGVESLTEQLRLAERHESPYLLIMGRKEALERSAILRNRQTQEETILPLGNLVEHLKALV